MNLFGAEMAGKLTLSGVQRKLAVGVERQTLRVAAEGTRFIFKPQTREFDHVPENEHATLCAASALGLETAPFGLLRLSDGTLAFLTRRFDREEGGRRIPMEDFCQLAEKSPAEKYEGSAELCVRLIRRFSTAPPLDLLRHWRHQLVSWWLGNGDLHLKNLALLTRAPHEPRLSPTYDLVNTDLVIPGDPLALPVDGRRDRLNADSWRHFATYSGLGTPLVRREAQGLLGRAGDAERCLHAAFLPDKARAAFLHLFAERRAVIEQLATGGS